MTGRPIARRGARRRRLPRLTPAAWRIGLITVGLLGAAVNTGNNLVYLMFSLLAAALPVSLALGALNLRRLRYRVKLPKAPRVGSPFAIDVEITPQRRWPALRSAEVTVVTERESFGPLLVERIAAGETTRLTLTGRGAGRGPIEITGILVRSVFPFGFVLHERRFDHTDELLILPSAGRAKPRTGLSAADAGGLSLSARVVGCEYTGLRRGTDEDDARRVDWKVTARRGMTIVRETAGEAGRAIALNMLTRCHGPVAAARRRFETQVSSVAGTAQQALEAGGVVHLRVDSDGTQIYTGRQSVLRLFRRLARLTPTAEDGTPLPPPRVVSAGETPGEAPGVAGASDPARAHRLSTRLALVVGVLALFVGDGIGPLLVALILGSLFVTSVLGRLVTRANSLGSRLWKTASIVALIAYLIDLLFVRRDPLGASLLLTVYITLFAIFNARSVRDDRQLLLVSFLHIVLAAALTTDVVIALPLLGWLVATIHGLIAWTAVVGIDTAHPRRAPVDPRAARSSFVVPGLVGCAAVLLTCFAIFAVVPHFGTGAFRAGMFHRQAVAGFSDTASLGDHGRIKLDRSKVMEVDLSGPRPAPVDLRWRGVALNEFDGRTWTRSHGPSMRYAADDAGRFYPGGGNRGASPGTPAESSKMLTQSIRLEPGVTRALFSAREPRVVVSRDFRRLGQDRFGNLEFGIKPTRRLSYVVASELSLPDAETLRASGEGDPAAVAALNLDLPPLDPRFSELASRITATASTRYDAAAAIESWLSQRLTYSLEVDDRRTTDPLSRFVFDGMAGHCEYFATAMVVLTRELEIPSRFVAGYLRGEKGRFSEHYVVRQSDAHAWVEVFFPGVGWMPFDPTPAVGRSVSEAGGLWSMVGYIRSSVTRLWDDYLVGIDLDDQARGLLALTGAVNALSERLRGAWTPLGLALLAAALVPLAYAARRAQRLWRRVSFKRGPTRREPAMPAFYTAVVRLLSKRGLTRRPGETPAEFATRARNTLPAHGAERLEELTHLYYRVRFDGVTQERQVTRIARALLTDVRSSLP